MLRSLLAQTTVCCIGVTIQKNNHAKNARLLGGKPMSEGKKAAKVLRYFPLKTRLQRLFLSSKTAESMR